MRWNALKLKKLKWIWTNGLDSLLIRQQSHSILKTNTLIKSFWYIARLLWAKKTNDIRLIKTTSLAMP